MLKKKKFLIGLVACLTILSLSAQKGSCDDVKSGWDYLQASNNQQVKTDYTQQLPGSSKNVSKRIYKDGNLETGVLSIKSSFNEFPDDETISISLRNADIKEVLRELARLGKKSIIIDDSVSGNISCELEDVSINQAMELALATAELESRIIGDTIFIASRPAMLRKSLNRRVIKSFKLNYANPLNVASIIEASIFNKGLDVKSSVTEETTTDDTAMQAVPAEIDEGGTTILTGAPTVSSPASTSAASTSAAASGSVQSGSNREVFVDETALEPASGFNDGGTLAGDLRIQGRISRSAAYTVNNNSGGPIVCT